jgi:hypothetical protein
MKLNSIVLITLATLGCTVATMAQNLPSYVPANGLVGWWPFNGNANDESGNGNNGIVNGATLAPDRFGIENKAFNFGGNTEFIEVPFSNEFNSVNLTVSIWVYLSESSSGSGYCILNLDDLQSHGFIIHEYNGSAGFQIVWSPNQATGVGGPSLIVGWNLITVTLNKSEQIDNGAMYFNGDFITNFSFQNFEVGVNGKLRFGKSLNNYWQSFNGLLDDVIIWNRILSPQEITALYTASSTNTNEMTNTINNAPGAISYQAIARDAQGTPLANANLEVQFSLLADSLTGTAEYAETHSLTTNEFGLLTTAFGAGTSVSGTFSSINWSAGNKYLHVQMDTGGGWVDMGTQQLLATPYSMHSATSGAIKNPGLPVFSDNAAAIAGGLSVGEMYRTAGGVLMVVY